MASTQGLSLKTSNSWFYLYIFAFAYSVLVISFSWYSYLSGGTYGYDLGIFAQSTYLLSQFKPNFSTIRGINQFGDHATFIISLLTPFFWIKASLFWLIFFQTLLRVLGVVVIRKIANHYSLPQWLSAIVAFLYLIHPGFTNVNLHEFHASSLATPLFLLLYYAYVKRYRVLFWLTVFLTFSVREDTGVVLCFFSVFMIVDQSILSRESTDKRFPTKVYAFLLLTVSIGYLIFVNAYVLKELNGYGNFRSHAPYQMFNLRSWIIIMTDRIAFLYPFITVLHWAIGSICAIFLLILRPRWRFIYLIVFVVLAVLMSLTPESFSTLNLTMLSKASYAVCGILIVFFILKRRLSYWWLAIVGFTLLFDQQMAFIDKYLLSVNALLFFLMTFGYYLMLPLLSFRFIIPMLPTLLALSLSGMDYRNYTSHSDSYIIPFLIIAAMHAFSQPYFLNFIKVLSPSIRKKLTAIIMLVTGLIYHAYYTYTPLTIIAPVVVSLAFYTEMDNFEEIKRLRENTPIDSGISASTNYTNFFIMREKIFCFPNPFRLYYWGIWDANTNRIPPDPTKPPDPKDTDLIIIDKRLYIHKEFLPVLENIEHDQSFLRLKGEYGSLKVFKRLQE